MTDQQEQCGHPTADGTPCQNPASEGDHCWLEAHGGETEPGRHSKFNDERATDAKEAARLGMSKAGCARAAGVGEATLHRWLEDHDEFRRAFTRARHEGEQRLVTGPLFTEKNSQEPRREMDGQHARFLLSTSFDYTKTKKTEVEDVTEGGFGKGIELDDESREAIRGALKDRYE